MSERILRSTAPNYEIKLDDCFVQEAAFPEWPAPYDQEHPPRDEQEIANAGQQVIETARQQIAKREVRQLEIATSALAGKMMFL